jgi:hypothetical protein
MKKLIVSVSVIMLLVAGCNNNKKPGDITIKGKDGESGTINTSDLAEKANEVRASMEELQKLKPYTLDKMKALVPAEIMGTPQSDYDAVNFSGVSHASAKYKMNDSTGIELSIMDCAGTAGFGMYNNRLLANFEQDNDREYTKSIEFNGGKAVENCKKKRNDCSFTFFSGNRFMVILDGNNVGIDKLKEIAAGLNIK